MHFPAGKMQLPFDLFEFSGGRMPSHPANVHRGQASAIVQKQGILPRIRDLRALCNLRQHDVESRCRYFRQTSYFLNDRHQRIRHCSTALSPISSRIRSNLTLKSAQGSSAALRTISKPERSRLRDRSGGNGVSCGDRRVVERGRDVADADHANQAVVLDHGQMADVMLFHQMTNMFQCIGRTAGDQLLH
jgi:hypothetical protein